jgi:hypothetical protein
MFTKIRSQESVNKSFVRVRLYYLYLPMDVCTFFLHIFNKKIWLQFICNKLISTTAHESVKIISTFLLIFTWKVKGNIFGYLYTNQTYIFFSYEISEFRIQELFEPLESVNKSFVRVRLYYLYLPMDVCTFFLHIFNKKIWLQFICNKLISTTAHESVKIISTKWFGLQCKI